MAQTVPRDPVIDACRGLALLGIFVANLSFFAMPGGVAGEWWRTVYPGWMDLAAAFVIRAFFENSFILIFSFLFGYGAARQLGNRTSTRFLRRALALAVIGVLHALLLWAGDILLAYALIGLALPFAVAWPPGKLFRTMLMLWVVAILGNALVGAGLVIFRPPLPDAAAAIELYRSGSFADIAALRMVEWAEFYAFGLLVLMPLVAAACLLGVAAEKWLGGRSPSVLADLAPEVIRWTFWPAMLGSIGYGILATTPRAVADGALLAPEIILRALFSPLLGLLLLAASLQFFTSRYGRRLVEPFRINGRISLSVYVGQSLACVLLFHGHGAGLYGAIGPFGSLLVALALFSLMTMLAWIWQRSFGQGPLERMIDLVSSPSSSTAPVGRSGGAIEENRTP